MNDESAGANGERIEFLQDTEFDAANSDEMTRVATGAARAHAEALPSDEFRDWPGS